jgi:hypothetical protein
MIRTCSVVIISQSELFTQREKSIMHFLFQGKNNRGKLDVHDIQLKQNKLKYFQ